MTQSAADRQRDLEERLAFETLISDLSSRFINVPPGEVDRQIEDVLRRVCEFIAVDLGVLWQWSSEAPDVVTATHVYYALGGQASPGPFRQEHYPWIASQMLNGRIVSFSSPEELPTEAAVDRESARRLGIKSSMCFPLSAGGEPPVGVLAFNAMRAERDWPDLLVNRLQLVSQILANALARKRHELRFQESEERISMAADSAEAGLWTLDHRTGLFWATERARRIFGYSPDDVISMECLEASIHPDDWDLVRGAIERSARTGEPVSVEYRIIRPSDGCVRWIASRGRPRLKPTGESESLTGLSIDITERKRNEDALRETEARLTAGADLAGLGFYEVNYGERIAYFDARLCDLLGVPPEREQGLQPVEFFKERVHPDDRPRFFGQAAQLEDGRLERVSIEYRFVHPARGVRWMHHDARVAARDATGHTLRSFGALRDITEQKRAEDELRDLSQRLIRAHEEERALLARELHDDLTQRLAVLAIDVGRAELAAPTGMLAETMKAVREQLVRLSEDIHSLAYQLHPSVLDELGLAEALRTECERRARQSRVDLSADLVPVPPALGKDATLCLYRVAQEALNNVIHHAGARAASVVLRQVDRGVLLAVRDDGVGFDPGEPTQRRSLGLLSMRERLRLVNGTLDIESAPGQGTAIVAWVPLEGGSR
jgi:PAS domain S-box-containing protein